MKSRFESKEYEFLEIESRETEDGKIVSIFLNNPTSRNSMTWKMGEEFADLIHSIKKKKSYLEL